jgi:hypothetical protein
MYTNSKIDKISCPYLESYETMYKPPARVGVVESANIFVCIYANIIAPSVGTSVTKGHITRADTTASLSKHVVAARQLFFFPSFPLLFFLLPCDTLLHGERMYAKTIFWMYNERCTREWDTDRRSKRLRLVNSAEVPFPYFAFAQHSHLQQQFFVTAPRRDATRRDATRAYRLPRVFSAGRIGDRTGYIVDLRACADRIIFRVRRRGKRTNSLGDENKYARRRRKRKNIFRN